MIKELFDGKKRKFNMEELNTLHKVLSVFYDRTKPEKTVLSDALYLRMKTNEILKNLK